MCARARWVRSEGALGRRKRAGNLAGARPVYTSLPIGLSVASPTCGQCGGPNPFGALNCQWCGATLPPPPLTFPPSDAETPPSTPSPDASPSSRSGPGPSTIVRVIVVAVFAVILIGLLFSVPSITTPSSSPPSVPSPPSAPVNVTSITIVSSDDVCGLNGTVEPGFSGNSDAFSGVTWQITAPPGGCTISGISAETGGFIILTLDLPFTIPSGETGAFSISLELPEGGYNGPLIVAMN